jgi:hypothetical protein
MAARQAIRQAAGGEALGENVIRTDPISDEEVSYLQAMKDQSELADFDKYVNSLVDPRKPGNLKWLMEIYPEFVNRRLSQVHTDYEYALRNQLIDSWGINTFDDLHFKYLVDQNKIRDFTCRQMCQTGPRATLLVTSPPSSSRTFAWTAFVFRSRQLDLAEVLQLTATGR